MRTRFLRFLGLALAMGLVTAVIAQQPGRGGFGGGLSGTALAAQKSVAEDLKLTDDQGAKVKKIGEDLRTKYADDLKSAGKDREKSAEVRKKMNEESTKLLAEALKPEQIKRLRQIEIQLGGLAILSREDVAKELKLTDKQKEDLKGRADDLRKDTGAIFQDAGKDKFAEAMAKVRTLSGEAATKFVSTLTDDQKALHKEMTGKKFEGKIEFTPMRRPTGDKE
jgi:Spy/CpxP family protein refolding chaperone